MNTRVLGSRKRIALVAHDNMKDEIIEWAIYNKAALAKHRLYATGTTGTLLEAALDESEGADYLMVKPALSYLDVISALRQSTDLPVAAYNVSGEYAMIKAAAQNGWIDGEKAMLESLLSIKRAGASVILSYFAKEYALLQKK